MMKRFSIIFITLAALLVWLTPAIVCAQSGEVENLRKLMQNTTPVQRARFEDMWMKKQLRLSSAQESKVRHINLRTAKKMQSIFDSDNGRFRKFRQIMRARDEKDSELQYVLTGKQFSRYTALKEKMWQKMYHMKR